MKRSGLALSCVVVLGATSAHAAELCAQKSFFEQCIGTYVFYSRNYDSRERVMVTGCTELIESANESERCKTIARSMRGQAYLQLRRYDSAVADFDDVIKKEPTDGPTYAHRGSAYLKWGKYRRALRDFDKAMDLKGCACLGVRGDAYFLKGDYARAISDYTAALGEGPPFYKDPAAYLYARGAAKARAGDVAGGKADMDEAMASVPKIAEISAKRGIAP